MANLRINNVDAIIEPYAPVSYVEGGFSSKQGTGPSEEIIIRFATPVNGFEITVWDADYYKNAVQAYGNDGQLLAEVNIPIDNTPGTPSPYRVSIPENGISFVRLVPGQNDYVWYSIPERYFVQLLAVPESAGDVYIPGGLRGIPGIKNGGNATYRTLLSGTEIAIAATPDRGYRFLRWIDPNAPIGNQVYYENPERNKEFPNSFITNIVANNDLTLHAIFEEVPYTPPPISQQPTTPIEVEPITIDPPTTVPSEPPAPVLITVPSKTVKAKIVVVILSKIPTITTTAGITVSITPAETPQQTITLNYPFRIDVYPIEVNISDPLIRTAYQFLNEAIETYIDEERELKTLVNYGEDRQSVALSWRYTNNNTAVQLKLLQPVPNEITVDNNVFLSREVAKSLIDKLRIRFAPSIDATPYLRPKNTYVDADIQLGKHLKNITLKQLQLKSGSVGEIDQYKNISFEDQIFRQWYSYDFNSAELNIDFTDYNNFVFYGSAAMRLASFRQKLKLIEKIDQDRLQFITGSITGSTNLLGRLLLQEEGAKLAKQKEDLIRGFDRYEQFLYFTPSGSNLPYTASAYYADNGYEFNSIAYWPKSGSILYSVTSSVAEEWFESQSAIAQRFDDFNENNLVNTIPMHVREDDDSAAYITFVTMIGHFFDLIKPYVDQMPYMYDRSIDPNSGLSKDLVNEIAEAFGFRVPTIDSIYALSKTVLDTLEETSRRDYTVETYKRLLHNLAYFAKTKGSRTSLDSVLRTLGITPQFISIRESGIPTTGSYNVLDEFSTGLDFDQATTSFIKLPLSSSLRSPRSLQFNFTVAKPQNMTILNGDDKWSLNVRVHPYNSALGKLELTSGSGQVVILSSSYQEMFGDELLNVSIRTYDVGSYANLFFTQVNQDEIIFSSSASEVIGANKFVPLWNTTNIIYVGGSGSLAIDRFDGTIDEVRLWGINLSDNMTLNTAFDPGSNAGDTYQDPVNNLYVQLSFYNIDTGSLPNIVNDTPYANVTTTPNLTYISGSNILPTSFSRYNRSIRQPVADVNTYMTTKVRILPPPTFEMNNLDSNGVKRLSRTRSILSLEKKKLQRGRRKVIVAASPSQTINDNIIRNFGIENINDVVGTPSELYERYDNALENLRKYYNEYYYVGVDLNAYIRKTSEALAVLNQLLDYFIPAKATLLKGIIIEPTVLERTRIPLPKETRVYGANTRRTRRARGSVTGSRPDYKATFNVSDDINIESPVLGKDSSYQTLLDMNSWELKGRTNEYKTTVTSSFEVKAKTNTYTGTITEEKTIEAFQNKFDAELEQPDYSHLTGDMSQYSGLIKSEEEDIIDSDYITYNIRNGVAIDTEIAELKKIPYNAVNDGSPGAEPYNRAYPRKLLSKEIEKISSRGKRVLYPEGFYDIKPSANFDDVGVTTYFTNKSGVYYFPTTLKVPSYRQPINFAAATSWSYGASYNIYDVVYQDIDLIDAHLNDDIRSGARAGNRRYYVFTTRPAYQQTTDGSAFYSGSVPSYIPPSLDKANWDLLRFKPIERRVPRRLVFDTFTISNPALNNYKITTIDVNKIIDIPTRYIDTFEVPIVQGNSQTVGQFSIQNISALFALQATEANLRFRLYRTATQRSADLTRPVGQHPIDGHGVLLDMIIPQANTTQLINPITNLVAGSNPPAGILYYTIDNLDSTPKSLIGFILFHFAIQIEPRIPYGHLRKHYRFFRDNSTATKRRNYLGCKNTVSTTIDGLPPVQIFLSEGTDITVSQTQTNEEIQTGGGGSLEV